MQWKWNACCWCCCFLAEGHEEGGKRKKEKEEERAGKGGRKIYIDVLFFGNLVVGKEGRNVGLRGREK